MELTEFIARWGKSGASERSNYQLFLTQLANLIGASEPEAAVQDNSQNAYVFDRAITDPVTGTTKFIDLYKRGCFVCEAKQGSDKEEKSSDPLLHELSTGESLPKKSRSGVAVRGTPAWAKAMAVAKQQAHNYARLLDSSEGAPPFLVVVDVGHVIELYSDFSGTARNYTQFQDGMRFRITLDDLHDEKVREVLRLVWVDPVALDPAKRAAKVTRGIASQLATLGKSLEAQGHASDVVANFLMRCLFSMFAEDVELIPKNSFTQLLIELSDNTTAAQPTLEALWSTMNQGGFSPVLRFDLLRFNGGLFADSNALPLNKAQLNLLIEAARADWCEVEPAIFGTLLERALSAKDRHKLGAHYTPRAYVERLVMPAIIDPLRADWDAVKAAAFSLADKNEERAARDEVRKYHRALCELHVLDPACGSGNFLYVAMEQMKRLEGEVLDVLTELGETQARLNLAGETVDPHQFLGLEINPWAAAVAELVLWIGYLQWHFRTFGQATPDQPVLKDFRNIECRDALLVLEGERLRIDEDGAPVTRWDGETMMHHPFTGELVPDASSQKSILDYDATKPAEWPIAQFIVGNPPFIGVSRMRETLGDGYVEALWAAYPNMPQSADLVMFWWNKAAHLARQYDVTSNGALRRFGFITTNSIRQTFNRRVLEQHLQDRKRPISLLFTIPDHPWIDSQDGASVRISMTVAGAGRRDGQFLTLLSEGTSEIEDGAHEVKFQHRIGRVFANLQVGVDVSSAHELRANIGLGNRGVQPIGTGFTISREQAEEFKNSGNAKVVRRYMNGSDVTQSNRDKFIVDFFPMTAEEARLANGNAFAHVQEFVRPERTTNNRPSYRNRWWQFGENMVAMREAVKGLKRYIATVRDSSRRIFVFLDDEVLPDAKLIVIGLAEGEHLAILSSKIHELWSLRAGGWLGAGNTPTYNHTLCFNTFPFPDCTSAHCKRLRELGERLNEHRSARQAQFPNLTLTKMYNVLQRLREIEASGSGEQLENQQKVVYEQGQIGILKDIHDQIDTAVADAYHFCSDLSDDDVLKSLVALNQRRHLQEIAGDVHWLRPEYQNPSGETESTQSPKLGLQKSEFDFGKRRWPKELPQQMAMVREILTDLGTASVEDVRSQISRGQTRAVRERLETLAALGQANRIQTDLYSA